MILRQVFRCDMHGAGINLISKSDFELLVLPVMYRGNIIGKPDYWPQEFDNRIRLDRNYFMYQLVCPNGKTDTFAIIIASFSLTAWELAR